MIDGLNFSTYDEDDAAIIQGSYNSIRQKDCLEIVVDEIEKKKIFDQTLNYIRIPDSGSISFQNLFKLSFPLGHFYIAQCLLDFGYPVSGKLMQSFVHKYNFQIIGIASLSIDLGNTSLRTETKIDKIVGRFFGDDIDFSHSEKFSDKYYLVSDKRDEVNKAFDKDFLTRISKYNNILLTCKGNNMFISFANGFKTNQSGIVEDILSHFKWLSK